ncbi:MAG: acetylornithine transaminase [Acidimicrobiia bacterium]|nr:acetylornithine transaminase [Acidimicrobiia bacterium]
MSQSDVSPASATAANLNETWLQRDRDAILNTYGPRSVVFERGAGPYLFDADGNRYIDFLSGLAVTSLGHANPDVAKAISAQANTLLHTSNLFCTEPQVRVAERLVSLLGPGKVFFSNSGAEANEAAIKFARAWGRSHGGPERFHIITADRGFHGRTMGALAATGQPEKKERFLPMLEGLRSLPLDRPADFLNAIGPTTAAVLLELIQAEAGVLPLDVDFVQAVAERCDATETLFMVDEVQTGIGRTGRWFCAEHYGVRPNVVTLAKALGNGVPIGATWVDEDVAQVIRAGDHASTFGGQPLATAAAEAVLDVMARDRLPERAAELGDAFRDELLGIEGVEGVRGAGLLLGVQLRDGTSASDVVSACLARGLVVGPLSMSAIRMTPALNIPRAVVSDGLERFADGLSACLN